VVNNGQTIVTDEVFDPFEDIEEGGEAPRGGRYYASSSRSRTPAPSVARGPESFLAGDENGTIWAADTTIDRTRASTREFPDLEYGEVDPGDTVTGVVGSPSARTSPTTTSPHPEARSTVVDGAGDATVGTMTAPRPPTNDRSARPVAMMMRPRVADGGDCAGVASGRTSPSRTSRTGAPLQ
jgi:hypothetical protein